MKTSKSILGLAVAAALFSTSAANAAVVIDGFDFSGNMGEFPLEYVGGADTGTDVIAGNSRVATLDAAAPYTPTTSVVPTLDIFEGVLQLDSAEDFAPMVTVTYNYAGTLDISDAVAIAVDFLSTDAANLQDLTVTVTLTDSTTAFDSASVTVFVPTTGGTVLVPLTGLAVDLSSLVSGSVKITGTEGLDFEIDAFRTVIPEPSMAAMALPLAGLMLRRRR